MKTVFVIMAVLLLVFVIAQFFIHRSTTEVEAYPYTVIKKMGKLEIRNYKASLFTSVPLSQNSYSKSSSEGFSKLGGYIFGANTSNKKIAMTAPVATSLGDNSAMLFMVPKHLKKEELPTPNQSDITFKEMPRKTMAVISFSGWADDEKIEKYKNMLITSLAQKKVNHTNNFFFFAYNPPYDLFFRKNEVAVALLN